MAMKPQKSLGQIAWEAFGYYKLTWKELPNCDKRPYHYIARAVKREVLKRLKERIRKQFLGTATVIR
jgi:hypothetical protein